MKKKIFIKGMSCQHCVNRVKKSLETIKDLRVEIDLDQGLAKVSCEFDISDEQLRAAVIDAGYEVLEIS